MQWMSNEIIEPSTRACTGLTCGVHMCNTRACSSNGGCAINYCWTKSCYKRG